MMNRFRPHEVKELEIFKDILIAVDGYLPLDFIVGVFQHMRDNPKGFDTEWLQRGVATGKRVAEAHNLSLSDTGVLLAAVMLLETGRKFIGVDRREGSVAFGISFINKVIPGFFTDDEIKTISYCLRYNRERFRRGVDGSFVLLVGEVAMLADVVYRDLASVVVNYVREHHTANVDPNEGCSTGKWHENVVIELERSYGPEGFAWQTITPATKKHFRFEINAFQNMVMGTPGIRETLNQNYKRIYSR